MRLRLAVAADVPVHVEVSDHPAGDELLGDKLAGERDALLAGQFARDGELDLAGELRVSALFGRLDFVP